MITKQFVKGQFDEDFNWRSIISLSDIYLNIETEAHIISDNEYKYFQLNVYTLLLYKEIVQGLYIFYNTSFFFKSNYYIILIIILT